MPFFNNISYPLIDASHVTLPEHATLLQAVEIIDRTDARIALVVNAAGKLIGSVTDGDIRRALLRHITLDSPVINAMHAEPYALPVNTSRVQLLEAMQAASIKQIPLLTEDGTLAGLVAYDALLALRHAPRANPVVIMAGGKGTRLLPLTTDIPKPMLPIGNRPMLEWIIQRFVHQGFREFYFAINHLGEVIERHFGNGERFGCRIAYIRETEPMGTAGALSLIAPKPSLPMVVINGDILASLDFGDVVDYHTASNSTATLCARSHHTQVPYGVLRMENGALHAIEEKPVYEDLVSAGIYVLSPQALAVISTRGTTDMPELLQTLVKQNKKVAVFPLREEWLDVGRHDDLEQARRAAAHA